VLNGVRPNSNVGNEAVAFLEAQGAQIATVVLQTAGSLQPVVKAETSDVAAPAGETTKTSTRPPSREGKRVHSIYLKPEAWKQLRMLSVNLEMSTQALGEEAINLLFEKHRLNRIARW
jgi:hypothetical protein